MGNKRKINAAQFCRRPDALPTGSFIRRHPSISECDVRECAEREGMKLLTDNIGWTVIESPHENDKSDRDEIAREEYLNEGPR